MKHILIVDDQPIVAEPLAIVLRHAGYHSTVVTNAAEALQICKRTPPDLVVCDIDMPQVSGMELLQNLRSSADTMAIAVMMLTGFQDLDSVRKSVAHGACDYLIKSEFTLERFLQRISKHFEITPAAAATDGSGTEGRQLLGTTRAAKSGQPAAVAPAAIHVATDDPIAPTGEDDAAAIELIRAKAGKHTFRGVVQDILRLASSSSSDFKDLAIVLRRDPVLASQCIATSNAAALKSGRETVTSLIDAARLLGFGRVRNIAATLGIFAALPSESNAFDHASCWQHGIATALILERLTGADNYLIGLCHDLGEMLVHEALSGTPEAPWIERDRGRLRRTALESIGLPQTMLAPMLEVLAYRSSQGLSSLTGIARRLTLAHWYAHALGFAWSGSAELPELENCPASDIALISKIPWEDIVNETMLTTMQVVGKLPTVSHTPVMGKRVLYFPGFAPQPSPLGLALSRWTRCTVKDHLPASARDYADLDAIVISGGSPDLGATIAAAPRIVRTLPLLVVSAVPSLNNWPHARAVPFPTLGNVGELLSANRAIR